MVSSNIVSKEGREFFEAFASLTKRVRALASARYAELGLGSTQAKFLRHIESGISQADLARATDTAPALLGRAIEPLIERGWIRRTRSETDRRQYDLELTASGKRMRERVEAVRNAMSEELDRALDDRDRADFERIAKKLLAHLDG